MDVLPSATKVSRSCSTKKIWFILVTIVVVSWLFGGIIAYAVSEKPQKSIFKNLELFTKVYSIVDQSYVEKPDEKQLIYGAIRGMLDSLDPHSDFMTPDEYAEMKEGNKGEFGGLGIEISIRDGILTVITPIEDTPAFKAGVQPGDKIIKIDETFTETLSIFQAVKLMKGTPGTKVTLWIKRVGVSDLVKTPITRAIIKVKSVSSQIIGDKYFYARVKGFQKDTSKELRKTIEEALKSKPIEGMVLDLRSNPGGLLEEAVEVTDLFVDDGVIVSTVRRDPRLTKYERATKDATVYRGPLIVMINEGSASASEIVAGALQDNQRALIVGQQSFGKGSVQNVIDLDDGSGMKITVAKWILPKGRAIQEVGVLPDIGVVQRVKDEKTGKITEIKMSDMPLPKEKDLPRHLMNSEKKSKEEYKFTPILDDPKIVKPISEIKIKAREYDYQLNRAFDYLKNWKHLTKLIPRVQMRDASVTISQPK